MNSVGKAFFGWFNHESETLLNFGITLLCSHNISLEPKQTFDDLMCNVTDGGLWISVDPDGLGQLREHSRYFNC